MSKLEDQVSAYVNHGVVPIKWAAPEPAPSIHLPDPTTALRAEITKLTQALGDCAIALDCMTGLSSRAEGHREYARKIVRNAIGSIVRTSPRMDYDMIGGPMSEAEKKSISLSFERLRKHCWPELEQMEVLRKACLESMRAACPQIFIPEEPPRTDAFIPYIREPADLKERRTTNDYCLESVLLKRIR